ncbi:MAG TPA: lysoplasmalogenase [Corynebacterium xerosis]|uniref:lysoplasmalogenase n=1 Tax=Corynebacterium xerosis TaxID=1725 RepID=UPI001DDD9BAA|nr:lysoplasmalogenase [Corynebacterium xerosis]HJG57046.1 lysoplasmalogenase [Corynebacterium xerosis]
MGKKTVTIGAETVKQAALRRTFEGAGALISAVSRSTREPERAAYVGAATVNVVSSALGAEKVRKASKTLLMPLLAASVVRRRHETKPAVTAGLLIGLAGGWLGDLVLMPRKNDLNKGAAAFAVNQIAYIKMLHDAGARPNRFRSLARYPLWAASTAGAAFTRPDLLPAAAGYGLLLTTTSMLGDDPVLESAGAAGPARPVGAAGELAEGDPRYGIGHGGNLFLVSDALLMLRALVGEEGVVGKLLDAGVMDTYTAAQLLLVDGILELGRK